MEPGKSTNHLRWSRVLECGNTGTFCFFSVGPRPVSATLDLQSDILAQCQPSSDPFIATMHSVKFEKHSSKGQPPPGPSTTKQSSWDKASIQKSQQILQEGITTPVDRARVLAVSEPGNGDWFKPYSISSFGLRLDNEVLRIVVALWLLLREEHPCPCGDTVDRSGLHGLSCHMPVGKMARNQMINDIIHRSLSAAGVSTIKEPCDLSKRNRGPHNRALEIKKRTCLGLNSHWHFRSIVPQWNIQHTRVGSRGGHQQEVYKIHWASREHVISSRSHSKPWWRCARSGTILYLPSVAESHLQATTQEKHRFCARGCCQSPYKEGTQHPY